MSPATRRVLLVLALLAACGLLYVCHVVREAGLSSAWVWLAALCTIVLTEARANFERVAAQKTEAQP